MILGIWDGHDSGAALVENGRIIVAVNEERFTRRKLEVLFPKNSILFCLKNQGLKPKDVTDVAYSTSDFSLTLTRLFPGVKDDYYYTRRKIKKAYFEDVNRRILNLTGRVKPNKVLESVSNRVVTSELRKLGFNNFDLHLVDHHKAHAASAYFTSGMKQALTVTMDGLGDGLSATINVCKDGIIDTIQEIKTKDSLGLFYQEVTSLLGMRILEDEGKVMCLADYSKNIPLEKNPMMGFFEIKDGKIRSRIGLNKRFTILKRILANTNRERFCRMAQDALENYTKNMFERFITELGFKDVCVAGGIFSNIKNNMNLIKNLDIKNWFVFPHMGDGGLAVGAALFIDNHKNNTKPYQLNSVSLGPEYSEEEILNSLIEHKEKLNWYKTKDVSSYTAEKIANSEIVYWFRGRMEYGPRALGNRSILAAPDKKEMRDKINKIIKRRDWFQPFCPSILESEARLMFEPFSKSDPFMTMGYQVKESKRNLFGAVQSVDGSCRPQIISGNDEEYQSLLKKLKNTLGVAAVLNTSFNIHGEPLVMSPYDALQTLFRTKKGTMVMEDFIVELK